MSNDYVSFDLENNGELCVRKSYIESLNEHELKSFISWKKHWHELATMSSSMRANK